MLADKQTNENRYEMSLTKTILESLSRVTLLNLGQDLNVNIGSNDTKEDIIKELMSRRRTSLPVILDNLPKPKLRKICRYLGLSETGMPRADLVDRILDCPEENWKNPRTPEELAAMEKKPRRRSRYHRDKWAHTGDSIDIETDNFNEHAFPYWNKAAGAKMKAHRKALGFSQKNLARMLGVKQSTISIWENAYSSPSDSMQKRIEKRLKMDEADLPTRADEQKIVRWITSRRLQMNLTQKELAKKLNVSTTVISLWETGQIVPSSDTYNRLSEVLGNEEGSDGKIFLEPETSIQNLLLNTRRRLGLTQNEFAKKLRVSQAAVSVWEKGRSEPRPRTKRLLLKTLVRLSENISDNAEDLDLAAWISSRRRMSGITQKDLAKHLETSHSTISLWENGKAVPNITAQNKLFVLFGEKWTAPEGAVGSNVSSSTGLSFTDDPFSASNGLEFTEPRKTRKRKVPSEKQTSSAKNKKTSKKPLPQSARIAEITKQAKLRQKESIKTEENASEENDNPTKKSSKNVKLRTGEKKVHRRVIRRKRQYEEECTQDALEANVMDVEQGS